MQARRGYGQPDYDAGQPSRGARPDYGMQESRPHSPGMQNPWGGMQPPDQSNHGHRGGPDGYRGMHGGPEQGMPPPRSRGPPSRPRSPGMHGQRPGTQGGYGGMQGSQSPGMQQSGAPWQMQGAMQQAARRDQLARSLPHTPLDGTYRGRPQD